jgi:DoxX-like family
VTGRPGREEGTLLAAYLIITGVMILASAWATAADLARPGWLLANMAEVGVPRSWLPPLAAAKGAGAAGLVLGLLGLRPLGVAAAAGLAVFFTGALAAHVRVRAFHNIAFPGTYWALAIASGILALAVS